MNRTTFIEKLTEVQRTVEHLLAQFRPASTTVSRLTSTGLAGNTGQLANELERGKQIERCVISTFRVAESMGFRGEFRQWEDPSTSFEYCTNETRLILHEYEIIFSDTGRGCFSVLVVGDPGPGGGQKAPSARLERRRPARPF